MFQSPQKPKGDCDNRFQKTHWEAFYSSNHPKSRKAIVTNPLVRLSDFESCSSNHPKSRKAIVTLFFPYRNGPVQVPITPKAERRL